MSKTKTNTNTRHDTSHNAAQGIQKVPKLKKEDFIRTLAIELTDTAWNMISRILGRPMPETQVKREKLLNSMLHKATSNRHDTNRSACQDLQQTACELYSSIIGVPWASSQDDQAEIKPRQSGQAGTDVVLSARIKQEMIRIGFPDCCECKNTKDWDLQRAILQARANTPKGSNWLLVLKRRAPLKAERIDPVVVMDLQVFQRLILACLEA